jgi:hypothetical protein
MSGMRARWLWTALLDSGERTEKLFESIESDATEGTRCSHCPFAMTVATVKEY